MHLRFQWWTKPAVSLKTFYPALATRTWFRRSIRGPRSPSVAASSHARSFWKVRSGPGAKCEDCRHCKRPRRACAAEWPGNTSSVPGIADALAHAGRRVGSGLGPAKLAGTGARRGQQDRRASARRRSGFAWWRCPRMDLTTCRPRRADAPPPLRGSFFLRCTNHGFFCGGMGVRAGGGSVCCPLAVVFDHRARGLRSVRVWITVFSLTRDAIQPRTRVEGSSCL